MKKILILLAVLLVLLCGCRSKNNADAENTFTLAGFSYTDERAAYQNSPNAKTSGFRNVDKNDITDLDRLTELARTECTIGYNIISVAYDESTEIYKFTFSTDVSEDEVSYEGVFYVYMDKNGVTQMTVHIPAE